MLDHKDWETLQLFWITTDDNNDETNVVDDGQYDDADDDDDVDHDDNDKDWKTGLKPASSTIPNCNCSCPATFYSLAEMMI